MTKFLRLIPIGLILMHLLSAPSGIKCELDPTVADTLAESEQSRWFDWIAALSGAEPVQIGTGEGWIRTRSSFVMFEPDHVPSAFTYLQEELTYLGFVKDRDFEVHTYDFPYEDRHKERNWKNLILTFPGSDPALKDERVLLIAHLDSTSDQERTLAPGADDNGSGVAGLLEAAAVLRHYQFGRTIHLIWFSGEEQSRQGSKYFVVDYADWLPEIVGVINLDMFAFDWDNDRCFDVYVGTLPGSRQIGDCLAKVIDAYELDLTFDVINDETATKLSDHGSFWSQGVPGAMIFENAFYQEGKTCGKADRNYRYHTTADTLTYINPETGFSILQASIATTAHMSAPVGPCFSDPPRMHGFGILDYLVLRWDPLENAKTYQIWFDSGGRLALLGETKGNVWITPLSEQNRLNTYQVVALSNSGCQSQPGSYPSSTLLQIN